MPCFSQRRVHKSRPEVAITLLLPHVWIQQAIFDPREYNVPPGMRFTPLCIKKFSSGIAYYVRYYLYALLFVAPVDTNAITL